MSSPPPPVQPSRAARIATVVVRIIVVGLLGAGLWIGIMEPAFIPYPHKQFIGVITIVMAVFLAIPLVLQRLLPSWQRAPWLAIFLEGNFFAIIALASIGSFWLYALLPEYDTVLHGFVGVQAPVLVGVTLLVSARKTLSRTKLFLFSFLGGFLALTLWELLEFGLDGLTPIDFFLTVGEQNDFPKDILGNILGISLGSLLTTRLAQPLVERLRQ